jgi:hypothetical protein
VVAGMPATYAVGLNERFWILKIFLKFVKFALIRLSAARQMSEAFQNAKCKTQSAKLKILI